MLNAPDYLARIGYHGDISPTAETLRGIHRAHMLTVPFENLDIGRGTAIVLDEDALVRKVVERRRGGFCYELNGTFAALLRSLGFPVTLLSARVPRPDGSFGPEFDHLALRVDLDEPWLADVGFGDFFVEPIRLIVDMDQPQSDRIFRIISCDGALQVVVTEADGTRRDEYRFTLQPRRLDEFAEMCHYHQTSPQSSFTQKRLCSMATPEGRITLSGLRLITTRNRQREERAVGQEEWADLLQERFGIVL
jgi:N-hydroxyarylamine O-acetyltransferase